MAKSSLTRESKKEHGRKDGRKGSMMKKKSSPEKNASELQVQALEDFEDFAEKVSAIFGEGYEELISCFLDAFDQDDPELIHEINDDEEVESFLGQKVDFMADDYSNNINTGDINDNVNINININGDSGRSEAVADSSRVGAGDNFLGDYAMGVFDDFNNNDFPESSEDIDRFLAESIDF